MSSFTFAFVIGLINAFHCVSMCGGIVGALSISLSPEIRQQIPKLLIYSIAYNAGRIISYGLIGLLIGWFGDILGDILGIHDHSFFRIFSSILVIIMGLYIGGWFKRLALIERLGVPIWKILQPLGQRLMPVKTLKQAFLFGSIWGWLPCGLVYYVLFLALNTETAIDAALYMGAFGLGTFLPVLVIMILAGKLVHIQRSQKIQWLSGGMLIVMGLISLFVVLNPEIMHTLMQHSID